MTTIKLRRGTAAQWTASNPVLADGEMGVELDTARLKFGNGSTNWNSLEYHFPTSDIQDLIDATIAANPGGGTGGVYVQVNPPSATGGDLIFVDIDDDSGAGIGVIEGPEGPPGPAGPAGPPGTAYLSAQWNFNQNTAVSPNSGTMRMDAATYDAVTYLWVHEVDRDGLNRNVGLSLAEVGNQIIMQSAQGRAVWLIDGHVDSGAYRTFTVTLLESTGTRPNASSPTTLYFAAVGSESALPPGGTTGQVLAKTSNIDYETGWTPAGSGGVTDHGALTGLSDDDHNIYHTDARGDARYSTLAHTHTQAQSHGSPDTNVATSSLHHTIGGGATQAAAGNHTHVGTYWGLWSGSQAAYDALGTYSADTLYAII